MKKILFVCHGNICRSPMAEFVFKDLVAKRGLDKDFYIRSAATSSEEIGNGIYPPAAYELGRNNVRIDKEKRATRITRNDYIEYDMIIVMEQYNIRNLRDVARFDPDNKIWKLLDFDNPNDIVQCAGEDISDPWYHGNFSKTYEEIVRGCKGLLEYLGY
ncbi:MAG: low molecular weight phosphotyrosine protein phosphatase [Bacteroidales bacterium]|nr:low molecular weight phosphotyrosine protein phosphatase [Bacteroidales bacterium]